MFVMSCAACFYELCSSRSRPAQLIKSTCATRFGDLRSSWKRFFEEI